MSTDFRYRTGDQAAPASLAGVPLLLGTCRDGVVGGASKTCAPGDDVQSILGPGKVSALALGMAAIGFCVAGAVASTYVALPAVTHLDATGGNSPTGPAVTVSLITAGVGPHDDAPNWSLVVSSDGQRMSCRYDGVSEAEAFTIPPELPAVLRGTVPITPAILALVTTLHFDFTAPAAKVLTFPVGSLAASAAGLKAATATIAAPHTYTASDLLDAGKAALLANPRRIRYTTSGVDPTHVPATIALTGTDYAGATQTETIVPATSAASVSSTKVYATITSEVYATAGGTDALIAQGYEDAYASAAEFVAECNTLAAAAPLAVRARLADSSTATYLELYSTGAGTGVTMTLDLAASTADTLLGFAVASDTGKAATRPFPWLGVLLTFTAGAYTPAEKYKIPIVGARGAVADYVAALNAAIADYTDNPFGYVAVVEDPATNANARALYDALRAIAASSQHDPDSPVLFDVLTPTALHAASATRATNKANVTIFEADLSSAFSGATVSLESVVVDDCYVSGLGPMPGLLRRPATWAATFKRSSLDRLAGNPADGRAPLVSLKGADGTLARADGQAGAVKLAGLGGAGFWCLKGMTDGGTKFAPSATRAGSLDRYRSPGAVAFALEASRRILPQLQEWEGTWETDPASPHAANPDLLSERAAILTAMVNPVAFPPNGPVNVANFSIVITAPTILDDGIANVSLSFNPLAVAETIVATITATGVALTTATGA